MLLNVGLLNVEMRRMFGVWFCGFGGGFFAKAVSPKPALGLLIRVSSQLKVMYLNVAVPIHLNLC